MSAGVIAASNVLKTTYSAAVLADSPLGYWRMADTGTTMADSSGNSRNGTYSGDSGFVPTPAAGLLTGDADGAQSFPAFRVAKGSIPDAAWMDASPFTVSAVIKPSGTGVTQTIIARYDSGDSGNYTASSFAVRIDTSNKLSLYIFTGTSSFQVVSTAGTLGVGTIYHIAATYDGTNGRLYLNGALAGTTASVSMNNSSRAFTVGHTSRTSAVVEGFYGTIDEVAFFGAALSGARISAQYAAALTP